MSAATGTRPVVVLIGPPGSGKSKVGRILAAGLGLTVRDTDADVEAGAGKPVSEIFVDDGEPRFRELEREAVLAALEEHDGVLSLGGGAVTDAVTQEALTAYAAAGGHVVFIDVPLAIAAQRVGMNQARPLLLGNPRAQWQKLMNERRPTYERLATLTVMSSERPGEHVAREIADALGLELTAGELTDPKHEHQH
ncbi:shikimate kinase [Promicromonospora citrea]|uniref:Shikimate kinase n=1 Tax=Promicromonospora citrea TaxID=43677 RepID=A0A8H9GQC8_9MICO|nr:shikimate kinase [Promicromonospora citrea]NNH53291.1 shikimate kinase [Promicromonospora citrea]GGM43592.1 shikimate kinase [Promicromonospora citrea]